MGAAASQPFASIEWSDGSHALMVVVIAGIAVTFYQTLGFILTMTLLVFTLLIVVERKPVLNAAAYSIGLTMIAWWVFGKALKAAPKDLTAESADLGRFDAILSSMTPAERRSPEIINGSRRQRIARGSGTTVQDVNRLLKQFAQLRKMMKQFKGMEGKLRLPTPRG